MEEIINRVAKSPLITLNLETYLPKKGIVEYDLKQNLFQELILKEKDFRSFIQENDWSKYTNKVVALHCSVDVIIPVWAYMLITTRLQPYTQEVFFGTKKEVESILWRESLSQINPQDFEGEKVIIKGCGQIPIPESAYAEVSRILSPVVSSLMYGEACSTVPIFKRSK